MADSASFGADVFINCPFDEDYRPCHDAIILCVVACGLRPRSALETGTASSPRMERISAALRSSRFSIHDLTRAHGADSENLARFNMPFEFGMAFVHAEHERDHDRDHDWLALLPNAHPYGEFISDLSGYDLEGHDGTPESVIPPVFAWLYSRTGTGPMPPGLTPKVLIDLLPDLAAQMELQVELWGAKLPWSERVKVIRDLVASRVS